MACHDIAYERRNLSTPFDWWVRTIVDALLPALRHRYPRLDVEALPDHLKRDLGFLDGHPVNRERDY